MKSFGLILQVLCLPSLVFSAELVVIESTSSDYVVGDVVDAEIEIVLAEDDEIMLIAEDGSVISLAGPYSGALSIDRTGNNSGALDALSQLVGYAETDSRDIGGVRGSGDDGFLTLKIPDHRSSPWMLHTGMTGTQCIWAGKQEVVYWREQSDIAERLELKRLASGESVTIDWEAGSNTLPWPDSLPMRTDEMYLLRFEGRLRSNNILLREVPSAVASGSLASVAFLAAHGCLSQARLELDRMAAANQAN